MKRQAFVLLSFSVILLLVSSCAGKSDYVNRIPEWIETAHNDTDDSFAFRGIGLAKNADQARKNAIVEIGDSILQSMNLGDPAHWSEDGQSAIQEFRAKLDEVIRNPEDMNIAGVTVLRKASWIENSFSKYAVDILWDKQAYSRKSEELAIFTNAGSREYLELETRAREAVIDGNPYESALIWAAASALAEKSGNVSGFQKAHRLIIRVLRNIEYELLSFPDEEFLGIRPSIPVIYRITLDERPIANAEFLITYTQRARNGSQEIATLRIFSDSEGRLQFRPPPMDIIGTQQINVALSANPFISFLENPQDENNRDFINELERTAAVVEYEIIDRARLIATGVIILEVDLAGNVLNSTSTSQGVIDDLLNDGFDVTEINLDPREIASRNDRELLRDLKADARFSETFDRVIHGRIALESFEQDGDSFTVRVGGTLIMSDIQRQAELYRIGISKTSRAGEAQRAISSAFRQLGRSFASELIERSP